MKKRLLIAIFALVLIVGLITSCDGTLCIHTPDHDATCTEDSICIKCGKILEEKLGHAPNHDATCTEDSVCTRCEFVIEEALGHNYVDCVCTECGDITLEHDILIIKQQDSDYIITGVKYNYFSEITIPKFITKIADYAFQYCNNFTTITIPESITNIGFNAFEDCNKLNAVYISDIAKWCNINFVYHFSNPLYYAHNLYVDGELITDLVIPDGVTSINNDSFSGYSGLISISIPDSVTSIWSYAFSGCSGLASITIPDSVTSIGNGAFSGCSGLASIIIPDSVTSIGYNTFFGCSGLTSVYITDIAKWCNIDFSSSSSNPFYYADNLYLGGELVTDLVMPDNVTIIGDYAFSGYRGLTSITIPDSVTSIGSGAFSGCSGLASITIPDSVTSIGNYAFYGTAWYYNQPDGVVYIGKIAYTYKGLMPENTSITLEDDTLSISDYAFESCYGLTSITVPDSITSIGKYAFESCYGMTSITVSEDNPNYSSQDGILYNKDKTEIIHVPGNIQGSIIIPNSVTSIPERSFYGCNGLTSITIPDSVTSIGEGSFAYCNGLTNITIPFVGASIDNPSNTSFYYIFGYDNVPSSLTTVVITGGTIIGDYAFSGCSGLTSITIPDSVTSIGSDAFYECNGLTNITIPDSVTSIGDGAFYWCDGLTSVTIGNGVTSISYYAFGGCYELETVIIDSSTIAELSYSNSCLLSYAETVYVKEGLEVGSYITTCFTLSSDSDKDGYLMYTRN